MFKLDIDRDYFSEATLENGLLFVKLCLETDLERIKNGLLFKARPRKRLLFEAGLGDILLLLKLCLETDFVRFGNGLLF